MTEPAAKYWSDVVEAVEVIETITKDLPGLNAYVEDKRTKWAVERGLAIIGEAVNKLRLLGATDLPPDADRIVAMRNRLIHSYDNVDDRIVWRVVRMHLSSLKAIALTHLQDG